MCRACVCAARVLRVPGALSSRAVKAGAEGQQPPLKETIVLSEGVQLGEYQAPNQGSASM